MRQWKAHNWKKEMKNCEIALLNQIKNAAFEKSIYDEKLVDYWYFL